MFAVAGVVRMLRRFGLALMLGLMAATAQAVTIKLPDGVAVTDTVVGAAREAVPGTVVTVHYTGWLYVDGAKGAKFDSSRDRGEPFAFILGNGDVIDGWDSGLAGMKVGGKRTLIIPPAAGYGARGAGADIPPNATLIFDIELLAVDDR
jgi:FKBP-type peptidyl-prolyl cis-trans isomerase